MSNTMMIETVSNCVCLNEGCDQRQIPRDHTQVNIDTKTGEQVTLARCPGCRRLYEARRARIGGDGLGPVKVKVITDERVIKSFDRKFDLLHGVVQAGSR